MSVAAEKLSEVLALSREDRALIAQELIASLETEERGVDVEQEWLAEIERRSQEMDQGIVSELSHEALMTRIKAKLNGCRSPS